jgi:hypothetical protein
MFKFNLHPEPLPELLTAGGDVRATMWDGRPRLSDCRKRWKMTTPQELVPERLYSASGEVPGKS